MEKRTRSSSFKGRVTGSLLFVAFPLIVLLLLYNFYSLKAFNESFAASNQQGLAVYAQSLQKDLEAINTFLSNLTFNDADFLTLRAQATPLHAHVASHNIAAQYRTMVNAYRITGAWFIYSAQNETFRDVFAAEYPPAVTEEVRAYMRTLAREGGNYDYSGWMPLEIMGKYYFLRILGREGTYAAVMVDFERIVKYYTVQKTAVPVFATDKGLALYNGAFVIREDVELRGDMTNTYFTGPGRRYLAVGRPLGGGVNLVFYVPQTGLMNQLKSMQMLLFALSGAALLLVPLSLLRLKKNVLSPMDRLLTRIGTPESRAAAEEYGIEEFKTVDTAFEGMQTQLSALRLAAYEKEIERQKAQLQYLHIQIRPHFYLNCLKCLYGMAQRQRYEQVQEMILAISTHLRYTFRDHAQRVPLREEAEHANNFIRIQQMAVRVPPQCTVSVEASLQDFLVPPLSIQTFVENCVKHAMHPDVSLTVAIRAVHLHSEQGDYVDITVQDNGGGFSEAALRQLESGEADASIYGEDHVGIRNVRNRLSLLYGGQATLVFFNDAQGAVAEMILPAPQSQKEENRKAISREEEEPIAAREEAENG